MNTPSAYCKPAYIRFAVLAIFVFIIIVIWFTCLRSQLTLETIQAHALLFREYARAHYAVSVLIYIAAYIVIAIAGLPLAALSTVVAGYLFGAWLAAAYTAVGAAIGGALAFLMVRYVIGSYIQEKYAHRLTSFNAWIVKSGWVFLLYVHFVPFIPFFMVNLLAGLTQVPLVTFIWTTAIGVFPPALIYASAGKYLVNLHSLHDIWSWQLVGLFGLLIVLAIVPLAVIRLMRGTSVN